MSRRALAGRIVLLALAACLLVLPVALLASPISYVPLLAAVLLVVVSWAYQRRLRGALDVNVSEMAASCERGQDMPLRVTLASKTILPYPRVQVEFFVSDLFGGFDDKRTVSCTLSPRETASLDFDVMFAHLGSYDAGVGRVVVWDLLGLFSSSLVCDAHRSVTVRPRKVDIEGDRDLVVLPEETRQALRPVEADDVDYSGVREYRYGDPLKTVHWTLSARTPDDVLYTRVFEAYVNPSLSIVIDPVAPNLGGEDLMSLFDGIVEVACGIAEASRKAGIESQIRYLDRDGVPASARLSGDIDADELVSNMLHILPAKDASRDLTAAEDLLRSAGLNSQGSANLVLVGSRADAGQISTLLEMGMRRRNVSAYMAVPLSLEGKERQKRLAGLRQLDAVGGSYWVVESTEQGTQVMSS